MSPDVLMRRCGVQPKKPSSAQKARAHANRVAATHGGSNPGRVVDVGALYIIGGSNGMHEALLRKRIGIGVANLLLETAPKGGNASAGSKSDSEDDESSDELLIELGKAASTRSRGGAA